MEPVERRGVQRSSPRVQRGEALAPRGERVRLVEPCDGREFLPEKFRIRAAEDVQGPALGRAGDDVPGDGMA